MGMKVELGIPYTGWPVRAGNRYDFGLDLFSDRLIEDLEEWARHFNRFFDDENGWRSKEAKVSHRRQGELLAARIADELGEGYDVVLVSLE